MKRGPKTKARSTLPAPGSGIQRAKGLTKPYVTGSLILPSAPATLEPLEPGAPVADRIALDESLREIALLYPQSDAAAVASALKQRGLAVTESLIVEAWEALGLSTMEERKQFARRTLGGGATRKKTLPPKPMKAAPAPAQAQTGAPVSQASSADRDTMFSPPRRDD